MATVIDEISAERDRQIVEEGWTLDHDDQHSRGELANAAACYASGGRGHWPWSPEWWRPKDRRSDLIRAGALIVAEVERLDRAAERERAGGK